MAKMTTIRAISSDTGISTYVIWSEIQAGRLSASKVGKQWYVRQSDWNDYLKARTFKKKTA